MPSSAKMRRVTFFSSYMGWNESFATEKLHRPALSYIHFPCHPVVSYTDYHVAFGLASFGHEIFSQFDSGLGFVDNLCPDHLHCTTGHTWHQPCLSFFNKTFLILEVSLTPSPEKLWLLAHAPFLCKRVMGKIIWALSSPPYYCFMGGRRGLARTPWNIVPEETSGFLKGTISFKVTSKYPSVYQVALSYIWWNMMKMHIFPFECPVFGHF